MDVHLGYLSDIENAKEMSKNYNGKKLNENFIP
jgi:hypothetical protein